MDISFHNIKSLDQNDKKISSNIMNDCIENIISIILCIQLNITGTSGKLLPKIGVINPSLGDYGGGSMRNSVGVGI